MSPSVVAASPAPGQQRGPVRTLYLELPLAFGFAREILLGVTECLREHPDWSPFLGSPDLRPHLGAETPLDGFLGFFPTPAAHAAARKLARRCVNVSHRQDPGDIPSVVNNDRAIGALAARHLLERGHRSLHFLEWLDGGHLARERAAGFVETARAGGAAATLHRAGDTPSLQAALRSITAPGALFVHDDTAANVVERELRNTGRAVPAEVAVIGASDDAILCDSMSPALSSVRPAARTIGRLAASWIVTGKPPGRDPVHRVPPEGVTARASTASFAVADERLRRALARLDRDPGDALPIEDLAREAGVSRRQLGEIFRRELGTTPAGWRRRRRMLEAQRLLAGTTLPLETIAERCGYGSAVAFWKVFRRVTGQPPGAFRTSIRGGDRDPR